MPAQKRPAPTPTPTPDGLPASEDPPTPPPPPSPTQPLGNSEQTPPPQPQSQPSPQRDPEVLKKDESEDEGNSPSSPAEPDKQFVMVKLADVRREVQCPICLGIIRKTRTVMECLHRFCRECIDKSMRMGNNECPACRTHCASRRSLRDDPNYDSLIAALYPNIDKYEEEELAFHEEERIRNKKIQASIAETFRRQSEALGKRRSTAKATAAVFTRRSQGNLRNAHGQSSYFRNRGRNGSRNASLGSDDDDEDDVNCNDRGKDSSSADDSPNVRTKRCKRWPQTRSSPAKTASNADIGGEDNDDTEVSRQNHGTSPLRAGNREMLAWGKGGTRSQTRHGNASISNGRFVKGGRITKLVDYLRNLDENDDEFDVHYTLLPLDEQSTPHLQRPHLTSPCNVAIGQLCKFIAVETQCCPPDGVEIFVRRSEGGNSATILSSEVHGGLSAPSEELQIVGAEKTLAGLSASLAAHKGDLVLLYSFKKAVEIK